MTEIVNNKFKNNAWKNVGITQPKKGLVQMTLRKLNECETEALKTEFLLKETLKAQKKCEEMKEKCENTEAQNLVLVKKDFEFRSRIEGLEKANVTLMSQYETTVRQLQMQLHQLHSVHQLQAQQKQMAAQGMPILMQNTMAQQVYARPMNMMATGPQVFIPGAAGHSTMMTQQQQQQVQQQLQQNQQQAQQYQQSQQQQRSQRQHRNNNNRGRSNTGRNLKNNKRNSKPQRRTQNKGRNNNNNNRVPSRTKSQSSFGPSRTKSQSSFSSDIRNRHPLYNEDLPPIPVSADHYPIPPTHSRKKEEEKKKNVKEIKRTTTTINRDLIAPVNLGFAPTGKKSEVTDIISTSQVLDIPSSTEVLDIPSTSEIENKTSIQGRTVGNGTVRCVDLTVQNFQGNTDDLFVEHDGTRGGTLNFIERADLSTRFGTKSIMGMGEEDFDFLKLTNQAAEIADAKNNTIGVQESFDDPSSVKESLLLDIDNAKMPEATSEKEAPRQFTWKDAAAGLSTKKNDSSVIHPSLVAAIGESKIASTSKHTNVKVSPEKEKMTN